MKIVNAMVIAAFAIAVSIGAATAQTGPVATACKEDIANICAGKEHNEEVRACLEAAKDQVSPECKTALETTGAGKGMGTGKKRGQDQDQGY
ncbi:MAG: hypothetical protein WCF16_04415 [Alphaproteobacteria bacterium]